MGIPYLLKNLQPYASFSILGCSSSDCNTHKSIHDRPVTKIVIDGPALVYYVYYQTLARKQAKSYSLGVVPSYKELGQGVLAFLNTLQTCGLVLDRIYFDGHLPQTKQDVRRYRLDQSLSQLFSFHAADNTGFYADTKRGATGSRRIPNPPFLVPAVIETLSISPFSSITQVVAAEADAYCAQRLRDNGGTVLTSDSDLLVYDLGLEGNVVIFDQIELQQCKSVVRGREDCTFIEAPVFKPRDIAKELRVESLLGIAYHLSNNPSSNLQKATIQQPPWEIGERVVNDLADDFRSTYREHPYETKSSRFDAICLTHFESHGRFLDPRSAELVLQLASNDAHNTARVYLWPLFEDPSRASAWEVSANERKFAYACLAATCMPESVHVKTIEEYTRKGRRYVNTKDHYGCSKTWIDRAENFAQELLERLDNVRGRFNHINERWPSIYWRIVAAAQVLQWYKQNDKPLPACKLIERAITGSRNQGWTWPDMHLTAQIEAALYSLRTIKQSLEYIIDIKRSKAHFGPVLNQIFEQVKDIPSICTLMPSRMELESLTSTMDENALMKDLSSFLQKLFPHDQVFTPLEDISNNEDHLTAPQHVKPISSAAVSTTIERSGKGKKGVRAKGRAKSLSRFTSRKENSIYGILSDLPI
ncbi:MAG: hypothetical protein Q9164_001423 [Protoblastenia rupestris]